MNMFIWSTLKKTFEDLKAEPQLYKETYKVIISRWLKTVTLQVMSAPAHRIKSHL